LIYVITGDEEALVDAECEGLVAGLLPAEQRAMGLFRPDASSVGVVEVLVELRTLPFLTERRVVVLKGADGFISQNRDALERYFDEPCGSGVLVFTVGRWDSRTKLARKLGRVGRLIDVGKVKGWELGRYVCEYARREHNKGLSRQGADFLVELAGDDLGRLYREVDKLAVYVGGRGEILTEDIEVLVGRNRVFNCFAVIDAVVGGRTAQAVERLRRMLAEDRSAEFTFVGAFAYHFRRMFRTKVLLGRGVGQAEVARRLWIRGRKEEFFAQVSCMSLSRIGRQLERLAAIDFAIKTGRVRGWLAAEQLVYSLAEEAD